jgi:hypothetical protein
MIGLGIPLWRPPAFSVKRTAAQTIADATATKILFATEVFDTHGYFDSGAAARFTPLIAGKYLFALTVRMIGGVDQAPLNIALYKNGAHYASTLIRASGVSTQGPMISAIIDLNGSTDFVEGFIRQDSGGNMDIEASDGTTMLHGVRVA